MSSAYRFCPSCAPPLAGRAADARLACACGYVHWDNPVPVVAAIVEHEGAVILARNRDWPEKLRPWDFGTGLAVADRLRCRREGPAR